MSSRRTIMTRAMVAVSSGLMVIAAIVSITTIGALAQRTAAGTARLSGLVVVDDTQATVLGGAVVTVSGTDLPRARSVVTDASGAFAFTNLPAGRFTVSASKVPYLAMTYGAKKPGRQGTALTLAPGQDLRDIALRLPKGGVITGTLRDQDGIPVSGVTVSAIRSDAVNARTPASSLPSAMTDERGVYRIFGLMPADYLVAATYRVTGVGDIAIPSTADVDRMFAELQRAPVAAPAPAAAPATAPSDAQLPAPPIYGYAPTFFPGTVSAAEAEKVPVGAGDERTADFIAALVHAGTVEGTIHTGDGTPIPSVTPSLDLQGPFLPALFGEQPSLVVRPGADGHFKFSGVTPGRYLLNVRSQSGRGGGPGAAMLWAEADVTSVGDDITGLSLTLQPGLRFSGTLVFDGTTIPPPDLTTLRVNLISTTRGVVPGAAFMGPNAPTTSSASGLARSDGTFEITGVAPGLYVVSSATSGGWWLRSVMVKDKDALDTPIEFGTGGDITGAVITFSDKHSELSGTLQTSSNAPATDYFVVVLPTDRSLWRTGARRVQLTRPASDGHFAIRDLPAGDYYIAALTDVAPEDLADSTFLGQLVPAAVKVSLADGEKKVQDLKFAGR